jgi:hypothetical protein
VLALGVTFALAATGCGKGTTTAPPVEKEPPKPAAPPDLLGWAVIPTPDASWGKLQRAIGGSLGLIPSTLGGLVTSLGGLDSSLSPEVDGRAPAYVACSGNPDNMGWVVSLHLRDARHARAELGDAGHFRTREAHGMTVLVPPSQLPFAVAFDGDRLLVARREADLDVLGAYASRTLPREPTPSSAMVADIPPSGMAAFTTALGAAWKELEKNAEDSEKALRDKHGGKQADFADTQAVLGIADEFVLARNKELGDFAAAHLTLDTGDDGVHVAMQVTPKEGQGPSRDLVSTLGVGDAQPLVSSWGDARASILLRTTPASRKAHAEVVSNALSRALGERLTDPGKKALGTVLHAWESGVSDALVLSLPSATSKSVLARVGVSDEKAVKEALVAMPPLLSEKAFATPLGVTQTSTAKKELAGGGSADVLTWARAADKKHGVQAGALGVASAMDSGSAFLALGEDPLAVLLAGVRPERKLGDDNLLAAPLLALGSEVSLVVLVQPLKLEPTHLGEPAAPGILALGRHGSDATVRLDISMGLLKGFMKKNL